MEEKQPEITEEIIEEIEITTNSNGFKIATVKIVTGIDFEKMIGWR